MKGIIIFNSELGQCEMYEPDAETMTAVWDLLNNKHNRTPVRVPETNARRVANNYGGNNGRATAQQPKTIDLKYPGRCVKCGEHMEAGSRAYFLGRGKVQHIQCPQDRPEPPKQVQPDLQAEAQQQAQPPVNGDAAFMASLASLMSR